MPRYFFHVTNGRATLDAEETELADMDAVRAEAVRTAGEILSSEDARLFCTHDWQMTVADERGKTVFSLRFETEEYDQSHRPATASVCNWARSRLATQSPAGVALHCKSQVFSPVDQALRRPKRWNGLAA